MSPEICDSQDPFDGNTVDIWAAGVILFAMLTRQQQLLWGVPDTSNAIFSYVTGGPGFETMMEQWGAPQLEQLGIMMSPEVIDLLDKMFTSDPMQRLSLNQVRIHPWMTADRPHVDSEE